MTDENLFNNMFYDRLTNTPPDAKLSEPKRTIGGVNTKIEFQCAVYIDPQSGKPIANSQSPALILTRITLATEASIVLRSRNFDGEQASFPIFSMCRYFCGRQPQRLFLSQETDAG